MGYPVKYFRTHLAKVNKGGEMARESCLEASDNSSHHLWKWEYPCHIMMNENLNEKLLQQFHQISGLSYWKRMKYAHRLSEEENKEPFKDDYVKQMHKMHKQFIKSMKHGFNPNCSTPFMDHPRNNLYGGQHPFHNNHGQGRILALLNLHEGINQRDLAYLLQIRPQSLGESLTRLEKNGLIERKQNENDKRSFNIYLTELGRQKAEEMAENRHKTAEDMFNVLTVEEKEQLSSIFEKLMSSLECKKDFYEEPENKEPLGED